MWSLGKGSIKRFFVAVIISALVSLSFAQSGQALVKGPLLSPATVKALCDAAGGTYFPPSDLGVYGCLFPDGTVLVCGGSIPEDDNCVTGLQQPVSFQDRLNLLILQQLAVPPIIP